MKSLITKVKKRKFFQLEEIGNFRKELDDLVGLNAIPASDVLRMLVHREHSARFNGNGHNPSATELCPICGVEKPVNESPCHICGNEKETP